MTLEIPAKARTHAPQRKWNGGRQRPLLPFDFISDFLPVLGFTEDAAVLATAIRLVATHITDEDREAARAALKRGI